MLSLRFAIVTAAAGLCLWGLFSLLDSLQEPGLLRSAKAIVVKGCDSPESQATAPCPALFCQKALLETKQLPLQARFNISVDHLNDEQQRVIGGSANSGTNSGATTDEAAAHFVCVVAGAKVLDAKWVDREEFDELTST